MSTIVLHLCKAWWTCPISYRHSFVSEGEYVSFILRCLHKYGNQSLRHKTNILEREPYEATVVQWDMPEKLTWYIAWRGMPHGCSASGRGSFLVAAAWRMRSHVASKSKSTCTQYIRMFIFIIARDGHCFDCTFNIEVYVHLLHALKLISNSSGIPAPS